MKKAFVLSSLLSLFSFLSINAQEVVDAAGIVDTTVLAGTSVSASQVAKWYKKKEWLNGVPLKPHKSIDQLEFYRQYNANKTYWDKAFAFLKEHDLKTLAKGKYPVDGDNVFVSVTEEPGKDFENTSWESHRKYIDVQCIITGDEKMGKWPVAEATTITRPYDEAKDVANYTAPGKFHVVKAGTYIIFFPGEAHRPNITPGGNKVVKKIVVKVKAGL